ncbi:MAG TPA: DUF438 domain-containing protein [Clostridiales bacterium]|nr:DUF438 domain-containing protein [Clostridiales bacterium]
MSEIINNREQRQKVLKELILELHDGKTVEDVQERFADLIKDVSALEISAMETELVKEGMPVEEIQRLCDVHAAVFKGSIDEIHQPTDAESIPGHPIFNFKLENNAIENLINNSITPALEQFIKAPETIDNLLKKYSKLLKIDKHYSRKENLLFPYLEKYNITAPPKVMWGVDDEIRAEIKGIIKLLNENKSKEIIADKIKETNKKIKEMIFKEENILFPMALDTITEDEWYEIAKNEEEIGYTIIEPLSKWKPKTDDMVEEAITEGKDIVKEGCVEFDSGILMPEEINSILNTLPIDITFVDKEGRVKYFSQGKERIFARPKTVLGREISNCHPPASVHIVEEIVEDLKSGKKDVEDFWIKMGDKYVLIRYFAVRNDKGEYLGTLEFTQNIAPIQAIEGEKRLASE